MNLFALLIGIDRYSQVPLPDGSYYPHLGGCVRDIRHVEQMLRSRLRLKDEQITKLISDNSGEAETLLPTYENLVQAFKDITEKAASGDQIYIHYSGHGGRSATMFEELKGANGLDESLVPCDIGENGACYLRDIEMAFLLKAMSEKGLLVTLVLDSCHSGGATRGNGGAVPRGITSIDTRKPPEKSSVADKAELIKSFREMPADATRNIATSASGWRLPTPKNCVIIAACRANELANEFAFDGMERNGALTYWMLDSLRQIGAGYTYKMLYNRVVAKVHSKFVDQTPQIEGDSGREIFGGNKLASISAVNVIKIDSANKKVQLNTGQAQGICKGAQFAIYPANVTDFKDLSARLTVVELEDAGATETWARIVGGEKTSEIQEGSQAVLLGVGIRMRGRVRLVSQKNVFDAAKEKEALGNLRAEISDDTGENWIRLATDGEETDFQVAVNFNGEYEIWDANGRAVPNLRPALKINDEKSAEKVAERLVHLTKYRNARLIDNTDPTSALARKIVAELGKLTDENDKNSFQPLGIPARPLSVGETACLRVTNLSNKPVNFVIMDFQPDWGISQGHPTKDSGQDYELLEPGAENAFYLPFQASLPNDYREGTDILKIFATVEGTSFQWLEMPALDQPPMLMADAQASRSPADALEELMTAFSAPTLTRQIINLSAPKGRSWATAEVEIRIRRAHIAHVTDPALSLLQSAFDEVISKQNGAKTRSVNGRDEIVTRPELSNQFVSEISQYCLALAQGKVSEDELKAVAVSENAPLEDAQKRGVVDTVKYCAAMAAGVAREWFSAKIWGDDDKYEQYKAALTVKFGDCDLNYRHALFQYLNYLRNGGHTPYRTFVNLDDFVFDGLPNQATVGIVADWATGEAEALGVLRLVKSHNPHAAIHLGDIYYAGTAHEIENYFYQPWKQILDPETTGVLSFALPGNHDLYAGGQPFYDMLDQLAALNKFTRKTASYFCLRNDNWQLIGLDTALHDRLGAGPTYLEPSEVEWLTDKIENSGGRRTVLLSHHQLFSANDQFDGKSWNDVLYKQLETLLPKVDLWLWGHEHDLVIFGEFKNLKRGRCIGGSAFPVGNFEMPTERVNPEVPYNQAVELSKGSAFYQHCYTILTLDGANATVSYYEDRDGGRLLFQETF